MGSLSKKNATVDKLKHEFNKMLINFNNVEEATNLREMMDQPSLVLKMINDLKQDLRVQQSNLDGDLKQLQLNLCEYKEVLASKEKIEPCKGRRNGKEEGENKTFG